MKALVPVLERTHSVVTCSSARYGASCGSEQFSDSTVV